MTIRNDASNHFYFAYLAEQPTTEGRGMGNVGVAHILGRFLPFTGAIADIHNRKIGLS